MSYIKQMLFPGEEILYEGHVHPRILVPGLVLLGVSAFILNAGAGTGDWHSYVLRFVAWLAEYFTSMQSLYNLLWEWQKSSPGNALEIKILAAIVGLSGFYHLSKGAVLMQSTELVVTTGRIIAKIGVFSIETIEMDKLRVAEVQIYQSFLGRIMGYGNIIIHGFTNSIVGLPQMVNPHLVEQFVS